MRPSLKGKCPQGYPIRTTNYHWAILPLCLKVYILRMSVTVRNRTIHPFTSALGNRVVIVLGMKCFHD